jgi:sulfite exporter TauE/SafE/copper chaperone CopZ/plastocyanin domain-containing protein
METKTIHIGGMTCVNCRNKIEKKLKNTIGIEDVTVNFNTGTAEITYNASVITFKEIAETIEKLDYKVLGENGGSNHESGIRIAGTLIIIFALYMLLRQFGTSGLASAFPLAEAGMGYGMLFVIGLVTSVHCVAMCGGINLSQSLTTAGTTPAFPAILYNTGRVISYTVIGTIAGALGSAVTVPGRFQGIVQLAAGVFMVIMGINMLGIFPVLRRFNPRLPNIFAKKIDEQKTTNKNPLFIGLLNGLMPCGPLQAMQLYALSTGSPVRGGFSMLLFSLGTVPLMFGIGALSSLLSNAAKGRAFTARVMKIGAVLVTALGLTMFSNGWNLSGFNFNFLNFSSPFPPVGGRFSGNTGEKGTVRESPYEPVISNGFQMVNSTLNAGRYPAITVRQGIPVKWTINAPQGSVNGCNNRMIIREYGIEYRFKTGENVIEFTPEKTGKFSYSCWMGMIRSSITVVAKGGSIAADEGGPDMSPVPAGVSIPADGIAIAETREGGSYQTASINLSDDGFEPSILVVQKDIPAEWNINNDSLDPGNNKVIFPAYYTRFDMRQGDNIIRFTPSADFDFSTADNVFYGYVKVVDDITNIDIEAIKMEAAGYETLMYPEAYFETAGQGGCCN